MLSVERQLSSKTEYGGAQQETGENTGVFVA